MTSSLWDTGGELHGCTGPYPRQLQQGYLGEIYGMAFFERLGQDYHSQVTESQLTASQLTEIHLTESQAVFSLLFKVEQYTAKALLKLLPELTSLDEALLEQVRMQAQKEVDSWLKLPWHELLAALSLWVEPYQQKYAKWADDAEINSEYGAAFRLLERHETAIYRYLQALERGDKRSALILECFLGAL
ncbi:hypothetical protein LZ659_04950 [Shewanella indica]|uniref:hypothetical protein n=1 Tax=Shewanella TaxID=22 RepID=UPI0006915E33|nr:MULTISPECIES: hypothetical protein [Shewanella]MCE9790956.1 hypothetical protein [Shewanella indica]OIN10181.1 hypothetical protein BFS86_15535 [Shewanella algae]